jgi:hypothetical protein
LKKAASLIFLALALTLACGGGGFEEDVGGPEVASAPAKVLTNVQISFNDRYIELLESMLSPDFKFYFDPDDVGLISPGGRYAVPESWGYYEFTTAAVKLFENAYKIEMEIAVRNVETPARGAEEYRAGDVPVSLHLMINEVNGYVVKNGLSGFDFARYNNRNGEPRWHITEWRDYTRLGSETASGLDPTSFGMILASYYH